MLGTHIHHVATSAQRAGGSVTMQEVAMDAIDYVQQHGFGDNINTEPKQKEDQHQSAQIGDLYNQALSNYNDFGTFQLALSNSMTGRSYDWDEDQFRKVLKAIIKFECSTSTPRSECINEWEEYMNDN